LLLHFRLSQDNLKKPPAPLWRRPAVVDALVDKNEPPLPGRVKLEQAIHLAEALAKGERYAKEIVKIIAEDKIREVI